jgi:SNF2 family DNA or RNA helicase
MLVSTKHNQLIINARNPNQILAVIPTAKTFEYKGHTLVAVPHRMDEVRVLNNLGLKAPSPIETQYGYPGVETPFDVQRVTAGAATIFKRLYVLNQMGTGKTNSTLWASDYLMRIGKVTRVLIAAPLSCLERVWGDSIFNCLPERTFTVLHGDTDRRVKRLDEDVDFYIINHHGIKIPRVLDALCERLDIDLVIVDELAEYSNTRSDNWLAMDTVINGNVTVKQGRRERRVQGKFPKRDWVWGLTGTPTPTAPTDAYAQCKLLTPDTVPAFFGRFRDMTMVPFATVGKGHLWRPRSDSNKTVFEAMQPAVRFTRDQCGDLPERMITQRHAELSKEQQKAYNEMYRDLKTQVQGGQITAQNAAVKMLKLVQIAVGVVYDNQHGEIIIPSKERLDALQEVIREAEGKVIVFVPFTAALDHLLECIQKWTTAVAVDGRTAKGTRDEIFRRMEQDDMLRVLVAHPGCMAHGLSLVQSNTIVWYGPTNSNRIYQQANDRITRPGQKRKQFIIQFEGSAVERKIYRTLEQQGNHQDATLELFTND